jgi:hypothetical protein
MTTPQNPGGGPPDDPDGPQDPSDPQNPYGTPPPPPPPPTQPPTQPPPSEPPTTAIPPAPPVFGTGDPGAPPAGQPPYGQPAYGQQPGYQQYPAAPVNQEPGKGMAIAALVISFFGCVVLGALIAIPLAIVVLVRSRDGVNRGKGLAIAAILVSLLTLAIPVVGLVAGVSYVNSLTDVNDLEPGDCITADGLTDEEAEEVTDIKTVSCSEDHDGEVLATLELTADQAEAYTETPITEICGPAIESAGKSALITETVIYTALTVQDPEEGDQAACVAYNADGSQLTGPLGG